MYYNIRICVCLYADVMVPAFCSPSQEELGFHMTMLDIGGGFSGSDTQLEKVTINTVISQLPRASCVTHILTAYDRC